MLGNGPLVTHIPQVICLFLLAKSSAIKIIKTLKQLKPQIVHLGLKIKIHFFCFHIMFADESIKNYKIRQNTQNLLSLFET